ncbi:ATP-binding cassette domain-containing protein [Halorhodospira halochloris]|uniref:ABC-type multidrug transport system n=1 Tax=Halorhodospira halochloris TaxID=1052 RepID=A0A110B5L0_HALHR|nr:ATP-binding cassette domain-containing protein [Halorhodospira halochloris]MBK1651619.1 daunorubicin/doxorubicin resistance ABC transporter ATP-binding protein DrrA [Halorhodospira halochloris]MCG5529541.1 ATP-binding cassette domain-containing protein [Halorhodospira halochloris]MCG5548180.1 ATP-binding cassette domain-containing protein [Halorhodospira halochloris]BAU58481.1 ABC-type multidrug transport system [Halorhodospira halochloris]
MEYAIDARGLTKHYAATKALDGVDLRVPAGTVFGLLGPNGAGKTTTVRALASLVELDAGQAWVGGFDVVHEPHRVREIIGLTGQYASVDEKLTGRENLILVARLLGMSRREARERAQQMLDEFHLGQAADRAAKTYSGGMRRRLDLAVSLVGQPRILFLDEPTTGLDPRARMELWERIRRLVEAGTTVLLTTQYLDEADALADEIVVINEGRVIAHGTPEQLKEQVGTRMLVVAIRAGADFDRAVSEVTDLLGVAPSIDGRRLRAPADDPDILPALVRRLDSAGIGVDELALQGANLDDVFLALTGDSNEPIKEGLS